MTEKPPRLNPEAMETVKRMFVHWLRPLDEDDQYEIINHLCQTFDVNINDSYLDE
jgi:hypothetical protein